MTAADQAVQTRHLSFNTDVHCPLHVADEDAILYKLLHLFKGQQRVGFCLGRLGYGLLSNRQGGDLRLELGIYLVKPTDL